MFTKYKMSTCEKMTVSKGMWTPFPRRRRLDSRCEAASLLRCSSIDRQTCLPLGTLPLAAVSLSQDSLR